MDNDQCLATSDQQRPKVAIIGNGYSSLRLDVYVQLATGNYDYVIGCNYTYHKIDYCVIMDTDAAHLINRYTIAPKVITQKKTLHLIEKFRPEAEVVKIYRRPETFHSSGHHAFKFAVSELNTGHVDLFGFDSRFKDTSKSITNHNAGDMQKYWNEVWKALIIANQHNTKITFHK